MGLSRVAVNYNDYIGAGREMPALTRVCTAGFFVHVGKARSPKRFAEIDEQIDNKLTSPAWHTRIVITIKKKQQQQYYNLLSGRRPCTANAMQSGCGA